MSMSSHLSELRKKHQALSEIIEEEQRKPSSDDLSIKQLKLKKLYLKEEIERLVGRGLTPPRLRPGSPRLSVAGRPAAHRSRPGSPGDAAQRRR